MRRSVIIPRNNLLWRIGAVIAALLLSVVPLLAQDAPQNLTEEPIGEAWPGEYIVAFDPESGEVTAAQTRLAHAGDLVDQVTACGSNLTLQVWRLRAPSTTTDIYSLADAPGVLSVEPNWIVRAASTIPPLPSASSEEPYVFNDTYYASRQWPLQRSSFARAWQLVQEYGLTTQTVRVAVIDSGVDFNHPDLAGRLLFGINYITPGVMPNDDFGHGTHVTGIIAAIANNGRGIAGGAPNVEIDPLKMLGSTGGGSVTNLIRAICDAADRGADVINMSLEIPTGAISLSTADSIQSAVDYAHGKGSLVVAAAGNSNGGPVYYPARLDRVVAVAALTPENTRASYSAIGTQIDIAAGGGSFTTSVLSTWPASVPGKCIGAGRVLLMENGVYYCTEPGTSMSAPLVSAAAALLMGIRPSLTNAAVETLLEETARDVGLSQIEAGAGLLDMEAAVRRLLPASATATPAAIEATLSYGAAPFTRTVIVENPSTTPVTVTATFTPTDWLRVVNLAGNNAVMRIEHGAPLYLTFAVSPTNLMTGAYGSEVNLDLRFADGSSSAMSVPIIIGINGWITNYRYLPVVAGGSGVALPTPPPFTWETPVVTPTVLSIASNGYVTVTLPFNFPFSGPDITSTLHYDRIHVYEDGVVALVDSTSTPITTTAQNRCLPVLGSPQQALFGWWADLDPARSGGVINTFQPAPDRFVVQYENVASAVGVTPAYTATFQVVLHSNGAVGFNYLDVPDAVAHTPGDLTPKVTVGVQARNGLFHNQVTCITPMQGFGRPPSSQSSILIAQKDAF
ncbi:MAG: S8 family peptidase [Caldilinea sp.]